MKRILLLILAFVGTLSLIAQQWTIENFTKVEEDSLPAAESALAGRVDYGDGVTPFGSIEKRKVFLKHIRDSIDAIPFDTTRDDDYWRRAIVNGKWSFFTDPTVKKPLLLKFASKAYNFYSKAFNNYDTAYVVGIKQDFKLMIINNDWLDSYGGMIADNEMKVFLHSNVNSSVGVHFSYMGIGYTYMFDLDNVFGGDPSKHSKWDLSFATSRFSFEAYRSKNIGTVNIDRFGNYKDGKFANKQFSGLKRVSSGFDLYYFFNHRKYSQAAAYSFSKIQKRSAGSFIAGFLMATQNVDIDFSDLPPEMIIFLPESDHRLSYKYHYRSYSFLLGYAYNWVFRRNWLLNVTAAPTIGWRHSYYDSVDGEREMFAFDFRARLGLVRNAGKFFYGLHIILDGHLYHSKAHQFFNSLQDITLTAGFRF